MPVNGKSDASNVIAPKPMSVIGGVFVCTTEDAKKITAHVDLANAPTGVTLEAIGYLTDSGPKRSISNSTSKVKAWGGDVILSTREGAEATVEIPVAEYLNVTGHKLVYGDANVEKNGKNITIKGKLNEIPPHRGIVVVVNTDVAKGTIVYDDAQAVIDGDVEMNGKDIMSNTLKLDLFPVEGCFYREFWVKN